MASRGEAGTVNFIPDRIGENRAYRLRCEVTTPASPDTETLERAVVACCEVWIADMEKQGWTWANGTDFYIGSPHAAPAYWTPAGVGDVQNVAPIGEADHWRYIISGTFYRRAFPWEYNPDDQEPVPEANIPFG